MNTKVRHVIAALRVCMIVLLCSSGLTAQTSSQSTAPVPIMPADGNVADSSLALLPDDTAVLREQYEGIRRELQNLSNEYTAWSDFKNSISQARKTLGEANFSGVSGVVSSVNAEEIRKVPDLKTRPDIRSKLMGALSAFMRPFDTAIQYVLPTDKGPYDPARRDIYATINQFRSSYDALFYEDDYRRVYDFAYPLPTAPGANVTTPDPSGADLAKAITTLFTSERFTQLQKSMATALEKAEMEAAKRVDDLQKRISTLNKDQESILKRLNAVRKDINSLAITLGLPMFCGTIAVLFLGSLFLANKGHNSAPVYSPAILLELITVLLITMTILILGLATRIQGEVLGTLLGGISGYVLNRAREAPRRQQLQDEPKEEPARPRAEPTQEPAT